jgi:hypothetical protein
MKTFGFAVAIVLLCVARVAQADVVPGNLLTNSDYNADLTGWLQAGGGPGNVAWTNIAGTNALDPIGGGQMINGSWEVQNVGANAFTIPAAGTTYYLSLVAGSPDKSAVNFNPGEALYARMSDVTQATLMNNSYMISADQLNAGWAEYLNMGFVSQAGNVGKSCQLWLDTVATTDNHIVVDRVVITTEPLAAGSLYQPVPEPSMIVVMTTGLISLLAYAWRKRR